jgi:trans-L-3-hydroxyproline dehydratase
MSIALDVRFAGQHTIKSVDTHTCGEPTRIIYEGYPNIQGTLLEQRSAARKTHDRIRKLLLLEPRGHREMYGAILRNETELTATGDAHIGVLFATNEGYSTMCGHATMALGRFLVDADDSIFSRRRELKFDAATMTTTINLHAPCGLIDITVPTLAGGLRSDASRPVTFNGVPSFVVGVNIDAFIPTNHRWAELQQDTITISLSFGGAFYCIVDIEALGFDSTSAVADLQALNNATRKLKATINETPHLRDLISHPVHDDLSFLYSIIVVEKNSGQLEPDTRGSETGLCFFGDQQIDRSPTGSGVAARVALAYACNRLAIGVRWTYHSMLSSSVGRGAFVGEVVEDVRIANKSGEDIKAVVVKVGGFAYYTGFHTFVVEEDDPLRDGFLLERLP